MKKLFLSLGLTGLFIVVCTSFRSGDVAGGKSGQLNENSWTQWTSINTPKSSWNRENGELQTSPDAVGYLRSPKSYRNFRISFEAMHEGADRGGIVLAATALPEKGSPFPDGLEIPLNASNWTSYMVESVDGQIRVFEGKKLKQNIRYPYRSEGYICVLARAGKTRIRSVQIVELPSGGSVETGKAISLVPEMDNRFQALYNGDNLDEWEMKPGHVGHWTAQGWTINYDGLSQEKDKCLWTRRSFRNFEMIADLRLTRTPTPEPSPVVLPNGDDALNPDGTKKQVIELYAGDTGIYLRGHSKNQINIGYRYIGSGEIYGYRVDKKMPADVREAVTPKVKADNFPGQWNRFYIKLVDDRLTVILNGITVIDQARLPGIAPEGPIALQDDHANNNTFQFANLFIREL
jgi:hypothetical protein